jgi:hypothetical protein
VAGPPCAWPIEHQLKALILAVPRRRFPGAESPGRGGLAPRFWKRSHVPYAVNKGLKVTDWSRV